jgi:hypothetical protein
MSTVGSVMIALSPTQTRRFACTCYGKHRIMRNTR